MLRERLTLSIGLNNTNRAPNSRGLMFSLIRTRWLVFCAVRVYVDIQVYIHIHIEIHVLNHISILTRVKVIVRVHL